MIRNETAQTFLRNLFGAIPDDSCLELRVKQKDGGAKQSFYPSIEQVLVDQFPLDARVWFGVTLRKSGTSTGTYDDLTWCSALWADFDAVEDKTQIVKRLHTFQFRPHIIVDSGGGIHAYWLLEKPLDMRNDQHRTYVRECVYGLSVMLKSDEAVHDPTRIMGLPGTLNGGSGKTKVYDPPRDVNVIEEWLSGARYRIDELSVLRRPLLKRPDIPRVEVPDNLPSPPALDGLGIPERLKTLVRTGWTEGCGYATRGDLEMAIAVAMAKGGYDDGTIVALLKDPSHGIYEKYAQKGRDGDRYLSTTIANSRAWLATQVAGEVGTDSFLRERSGHLESKRRKDEWEQVLTRPLQASARLYGDVEGFRVKIPHTGTGADADTEPRLRTLRFSDLINSIALKKALNGAAAWLGNDRDVQLLIPFLESQHPPRKRAVRSIGWHGDEIIFPNASIAKDGTLITDTDYLYVPLADSLNQSESLDNVRLEEHEDWPTLARDALDMLIRINNLTTMLPLIGWFMATFAAPKIRALDPSHAFPLLMAFGSTGAGKSTTLQQLIQMCGGDGTLLHLQGQTKFTNAKFLSSSNTFPIIYDENQRTVETQRARVDLQPDFRVAYNAGIITRGRVD